MKKEILTTGDIAKYCNVNFRTVVRWCERGLLKSHKLPGRGDNRIQEKDFINFLKENNLPFPSDYQTYAHKVLVVDDDKDMINLIKLKLQKKGFEVKSASDGFRAGTLLHSFAPAVMTLDLKMPGLSGFDVLKAIREQNDSAKQKILVISSSGEEDLQKAREMGADDTLKKPFATEELIQKILQLAES